MKTGDIVDYGGITCKVKVISERSIVIKSEKGNIYKVRYDEIAKTTKIFKEK